MVLRVLPLFFWLTQHGRRLNSANYLPRNERGRFFAPPDHSTFRDLNTKLLPLFLFYFAVIFFNRNIFCYCSLYYRTLGASIILPYMYVKLLTYQTNADSLNCNSLFQ